jgi:16S rRNA pseudouridine516 synthase
VIRILIGRPIMKLDRFLAKHSSMGRSAAHLLIAGGHVQVNGVVVLEGSHAVDRFSRIELKGELLQRPERALYLMLHKPVGFLSATSDEQHPTVIDLIDDPDKDTLHIAGRLDRSTSGLVLLTNDGRWSKRLMDPDAKVPKVYRVETLDPIVPEAVEAFARGFYFHTEEINTLPAKLEILGERQARLTLHEGRYHQVKRMFHRVNNRVTSLHRESVGAIKLPDDLLSGQWRPLTEMELRLSVTPSDECGCRD